MLAVRRYGIILIMKRILYISAILCILLFSCATGNYLKTEDAKDADIRGSFALILYGSRHLNDIETVAILDIEGDSYSFEPYAPEFDYKIKKRCSCQRGTGGSREVCKLAQFISTHTIK